MSSCWVQWSDISVHIIPAACGLMQSCRDEEHGGVGGGFWKLFQTDCKYQGIVGLQQLQWLAQLGPGFNPD